MILTNNDFILKNDEYLQDGVIFCKNCHTPRMVVLQDFKTRCLCLCQSKKRDEEFVNKRKAEEFEKIKNLKASSLMAEKYMTASFDNTDLNRPQSFLNALSRGKKFCMNWKNVSECGAGMFLYGNKGTGKTYITACIANYLMDRLVPVHMTNLLEFSKKIRACYSNDYETEDEVILKFAQVPLLIIDDVSIVKFTKNKEDLFIQEKFYDLANYRYIKNLPTLFSSNLSLEDLVRENGLSPVTADRISEMCHAVIKLEGDSYRRKIVQERAPLF